MLLAEFSPAMLAGERQRHLFAAMIAMAHYFFIGGPGIKSSAPGKIAGHPYVFNYSVTIYSYRCRNGSIPARANAAIANPKRTRTKKPVEIVLLRTRDRCPGICSSFPTRAS
jgi:hypothetical protein